MKDLVIVCEDSFGLDVKMIAEGMDAYYVKNNRGHLFDIIGFICPENVKEKLQFKTLPFLSTIEDYQVSDNMVFAMGIVDPGRKEKYIRLLKEKNAEFVTLWAPWVLAPLTMKFKEGCIIAAHSIKENAEIGEFVTMFHSMAGGAKVGSFSSIMSYANVTTADIGEGVYIAPNCAVMENVVVGEKSVIFPNSVVVKNVKANTKVSGIPARKVKD